MPEPTTPEPALPEPTTPDPALPEPTTPEPALPDSTTPEPNGHAADAPLLTSVVDGVGHVVLNRPRALNCLTQSMVDALLATIAAWEQDPRVRLVHVTGAGDRALCAGGDVVAARAAIVDGRPDDASAFWAQEYAAIAALAAFARPVIALQHGYVMGGGVGLSAHARHRWATQDARFAMPETAIGFFPDVAMTPMLARAPGELGAWLAMTGETIGAVDAQYVGLTDVVLPTESVTDALTATTRLAADGDVSDADIQALAAAYGMGAANGVGPAEGVGTANGAGTAYGNSGGVSRLQDDREWIDACFPGDDPALIVARLEEHPDARARACGALLRTRSPLAVAVSLARLRRAETEQNLASAFATDRRIADAMMHGGDFVEGVRARLIDKDQPRWRHTRIEDVSAADVATYLDAR